MRHTRGAMLGVLRSDYIRTARAKGLLSRAVILQARLPQRAGADRDALDAAVRRAAGRRGADRAGLHHPGLRQAGRRCRVQPRLRGGAGRGAVHGGRLHRHEPPRRHSLCPRQPAAEGMPHDASPSPPRRRAAAAAQPRPRQVPAATAAPCWAARSSLFFVLVAIARAAASRPSIRSSRASRRIRKAPSALFWLGTDELGRDMLSRLIWGARASLMAGVVSVAIAVAARRAVRPRRRLFRRLDRRGHLAGDGGACSRCPFLILAIALAAFLGPSLTNAMIAIGLSAMPIFVRLTRGQVLDGQGGGLRRGRARHRPARSAGSSCATSAERPAADPRPGDADHRDRDHRRGEPVVPWPRPAAAEPVLGLDAEHGQELHGSGALDVDLSRARRSSSSCSASTCSATACATRSIRANTKTSTRTKLHVHHTA